MRKSLLYIFFLSLIITSVFCYSRIIQINESVYKTSFDEVITKIKQPEDVSSYILQNIKYQADRYLFEENRFAEETASLGYGDCEDMAILGEKMLKKIGVEATTYMIVNQSEAHCVCIWKDDQNINVLNNGQLIEVAGNDLTAAARAIYPDFVYFDRYST